MSPRDALPVGVARGYMRLLGDSPAWLEQLAALLPDIATSSGRFCRFQLDSKPRFTARGASRTRLEIFPAVGRKRSRREGGSEPPGREGASLPGSWHETRRRVPLLSQRGGGFLGCRQAVLGGPVASLRTERATTPPSPFPPPTPPPR